MLGWGYGTYGHVHFRPAFTVWHCIHTYYGVTDSTGFFIKHASREWLKDQVLQYLAAGDVFLGVGQTSVWFVGQTSDTLTHTPRHLSVLAH